MSNTPSENRARFGVPENSMVFARGVRKSYGPLEVLKGVDIDVPAGSVACIIGPSGSGKSTFLRCINHLEKLTGGILLVDGAFVGREGPAERLCQILDRNASGAEQDGGLAIHANDGALQADRAGASVEDACDFASQTREDVIGGGGADLA